MRPDPIKLTSGAVLTPSRSVPAILHKHTMPELPPPLRREAPPLHESVLHGRAEVSYLHDRRDPAAEAYDAQQHTDDVSRISTSHKEVSIAARAAPTASAREAPRRAA